MLSTINLFNSKFSNFSGLLKDVSAVYSSPVLRCVQTAKFVVPTAEITTNDVFCGGPMGGSFSKEWVVFKEKEGYW